MREGERGGNAGCMPWKYFLKHYSCADDVPLTHPYTPSRAMYNVHALRHTIKHKVSGWALHTHPEYETTTLMQIFIKINAIELYVYLSRPLSLSQCVCVCSAVWEMCMPIDICGDPRHCIIWIRFMKWDSLSLGIYLLDLAVISLFELRSEHCQCSPYYCRQFFTHTHTGKQHHATKSISE